MGMPVRKKRVGLEDRAEQRQVKIQFKTVDRPASGVAHKFPRRSYNLLLNYSLSRGCRATEPLSSFYIPRYWYARLENRCLRRRYIGPDIETEEPRDRFHSFHPSGQSIRDSKIYHQFPSIQHETDIPIEIGHHSIRKFDNVHFRFCHFIRSQCHLLQSSIQ